MTGQGVRWSAEQVLALAPDAASRRAGSRLSDPGPWTEAGAGTAAVWGLCEGSGSRPYQTVVDLNGGSANGSNGLGYRCSCPSQKFPCKHALGLLLLWAGERKCIAEGAEPPEWAEQWLTGRRKGAQKTAGINGAAKKGTSEAAAGDSRVNGARSSASGDAARRRAERRTQRMAAGAAELEERLADLLRGGLAGADQAGYATWDEMAARMVDAQAPGLAARVRELGAVASSGSGWPARLLSECALLHLLDQGLLALADPEKRRGEGSKETLSGHPLPERLAATVRARAGLTVDAAELLADERARVRDQWLVLAQRDEEEGRLIARRIWLYGQDTGRVALLRSFGAAGRAPGIALPVGSTVDAELAFHPGVQPLRAALGERYGVPGPGFEPPGVPLHEALEAYGAALCEDPWLDGWPVVLRETVPIPGAGTSAGAYWQVADGTRGDSSGGAALPVAPGTAESALWRMTAMSGGGPLTVFGECGHRGFTPYTAWSEGRAVQL